jgi:hypothetical protein
MRKPYWLLPDIPHGTKVRIIRGKLRGVEAVCHQSSNDWIMLELPNRDIKILSKTSVEIINQGETHERQREQGNSEGD